MHRIIIVLVVAIGIVLGMAGTATATPVAVSVPGVAVGGAVQRGEWYTYGRYATEAQCKDKGRHLVAIGYTSGYACSYQKNINGLHWTLRLYD